MSFVSGEGAPVIDILTWPGNYSIGLFTGFLILACWCVKCKIITVCDLQNLANNGYSPTTAGAQWADPVLCGRCNLFVGCCS